MAKRKQARPWWRRWLRRAFVAGAGFVLLTIALILPLRWVNPLTTAFMLQDDSGRQPLLQEWVPWDALGSAAALAVVAAEDQKFAEHFGLDLGSIADAIGHARRGGNLRGASTISQQVSKNLFLWPGKSLFRKGLEAYLTLFLEACLPKRRILGIYLNIAQFGPGIYGVGSAAQHFYGRPVAQLTDAEAALLAAVLPNPVKFQVAHPSAYVRQRQAWIMSQIQRLRRENWMSVLNSS